MEGPSLVCYEQNKDTRFFVCRHCKTHLSLYSEMLYRYPTSHVAIFGSMVNVDLLSDKHPIEPGETSAAAFCINCESQIALRLETYALKTGRFMVDTSELLFWNGNHMVYADSGVPVQNA
ncbi:PREDICTED: uncharacterized protein LOC105963646 isoform X2 [Erythranthe guttata]|uniref:uncharacterized protein LOC105963646 isoform X2 n=1 Tax=Erythranthe guttata TaxID=4155 RepID=UPI00064DBC80|nr:PREDICTED: uncharacterized protein LOC105963646 isoform X2 [Erythranthe guttata]|eukprot:XP_012843522.1 PREDICTED: uncharacterized protein LOC105963646 isoform X2 [Erythranthe guttata]